MRLRVGRTLAPLCALVYLVMSTACVQVNIAPPTPAPQDPGKQQAALATPAPPTAAAPNATPQPASVQQPTPAPPVAVAPPPAIPSQPDISDVVARTAPAVVQVLVSDGAGSGVSVAEGVLTNHHVVKGGGRIELVIGSGRRVPATVVRQDPTADIALLRTDASLPTLELDSEVQRVGGTLLVLGFPRSGEIGGQMTLTRGVVSATRDEAGVSWLQTDAAMNPGNSGGPVVNMDGKLVGLATWGLRNSQGLNFAVAGPAIRRFLSGAEARPPAPPQPTTAPPKPAPTLRATTPPTSTTGQGDPRRTQIERRVGDYFQALNAGDYARAHSICCTPSWRSRYPLDQWQANFRGVTELRYATPFRYIAVEPNHTVVEVDYSFVSRGERRYWTLRWTFVPVGGDWLADEAQASPQTR